MNRGFVCKNGKDKFNYTNINFSCVLTKTVKIQLLQTIKNI